MLQDVPQLLARNLGPCRFLTISASSYRCFSDSLRVSYRLLGYSSSMPISCFCGVSRRLDCLVDQPASIAAIGNNRRFPLGTTKLGGVSLPGATPPPSRAKHPTMPQARESTTPAWALGLAPRELSGSPGSSSPSSASVAMDSVIRGTPCFTRSHPESSRSDNDRSTPVLAIPGWDSPGVEIYGGLAHQSVPAGSDDEVSWRRRGGQPPPERRLYAL